MTSAWLYALFWIASKHFLSHSLFLCISGGVCPKPLNTQSSYTTIMPSVSDLSVPIYSHIAQGDRHIIWRSWLHKEHPPSLSDPLLDQSDSVLRKPLAWQRGSRGRRHVSSSGGSRGHGHLMRVGCVLGTCQVQNLSHRLYQLIGQSGREDSSPINPRSPHSYG